MSLAFTLLFGYRKALYNGNNGGTPPSADLAVILAGGRCFIDGIDPYDGRMFSGELQRYAQMRVLIGEPGLHASDGWPYPPTALPVVAPFAVLPFHLSVAVWWTICFGLFVIMSWVSCKWAAPEWKSDAIWAFIGITAQSRLLLMTAYRGQTGLPVAAILIVATWLVSRNRKLEGGGLAALGLLKPTFLIPWIGHMLVSRAWKTVAVLTLSAIPIIGAALFLGPEADLVAGFRRVTAANVATGGSFDTSSANPISIGIDNVDVLFSRLGIEGVRLSTIHAIVLLVSGLWIVVITARTRRENLFAVPLWTAWMVWGHLMLYHRAYDLFILWPAIAWTVAELRRGNRSPQMLLATGIICFVVFVLSIQPIEQTFISSFQNSGFAWAANLRIPLLAALFIICARESSVVRASLAKCQPA